MFKEVFLEQSERKYLEDQRNDLIVWLKALIK